MSETIVTSTAAATTAAAVPLLTGAGVVLGAARLVGRAAASLLAEGAQDTSESIGADSLAATYVAAARAARDRAMNDFARHRGAVDAEAVDALARAEALREAFRATPALALVAESHGRHGVEGALRLLTEARTAYAQGGLPEATRRAREAEQTLALSARDAAERLASSQRRLVADKVRQALPALGYVVHEAEGNQRIAFRATSGEQVLGVVISEGGRLLVEAAGCEGATCRPAVTALFHRLRDEGIAIEPVLRQAHGRFEGGPLLEQAGRGAEGLLRAADRLHPAPREEGGRRGNAANARGRRAAAWIWRQGQEVGR